MTSPVGYFTGTLDPVFPTYRDKVPKIVWNNGTENTLEFGMPLLDTLTYSEGDADNESMDVQDGTRDGWKVGFNQFLSATLQYVPRTDEITSYGLSVTGWEGVTGWRAFIIWASQHRGFEFYPDRNVSGTLFQCYLIKPYGERSELTVFLAKKPKILLSTIDRSQFTGY